MKSVFSVKNLSQVVIIGLCLFLLLPVGVCASDFKVITIGTGAPPPEIERFGPATLVEVGGRRLLFDAGRGVTQRLWQAKISLGSLEQVFLTHLHSDHIVGLSDLYLTSMLPGPFGSRTQPFRIMGAAGTEKMMSLMKQAFQADIDIRYNDGEMKDEQAAFEARDITEGVVYEKDGVKVTAFDNYHGDAIKPSLGYRVDYKGRSVVISGDTKYSDNVVKHSKGADLLIHTVGMANAELLKLDTAPAKVAKNILGHHTPPEDAAKVFMQTKPKLAVFTHMVTVAIGDMKKFPPPKQPEFVEATRAAGYGGPLAIARDLMTFDIGDTINVVAFEEKNPASVK
jgi:ribonuclease Z